MPLEQTNEAAAVLDDEAEWVEALRALCEREGGARRVAQRAKVNAAALYQVMAGVKLPSGNPRNLGPNTRNKLEKAFPGWRLLGHVTARRATPSAHVELPTGVPFRGDNTYPSGGADDRVPIINWQTAARWHRTMRRDETGTQGHMPCPVAHSGETFALRVRNDSMMDPTAPHSFSLGDVIFVDPQADARSGSFVLVSMPGGAEAIFRKLSIEAGRPFLQALNPRWTDPMVPMPHDAVIVGVVIYRGVDLRPHEPA